MANKSPAFFERGSWYHRIKILNEDGTTKYMKKGGFESETAAVQSFRRYEEEYKQAVRVRKAAAARDFDLRDYLLYWLTEIFSARAENTSRALATYVVNDLLMPNLTQRVRIRSVTTDYLDTVLESASKVCESAGNKSREVLNMAFKDAVKQGYIAKNPVTGTRAYRRRKPQITILNKERMQFFLSKAATDSWYLEILLALFMGLRKGEIAGLKFGDFDLERRTVRIERQVVLNPDFKKGSTEISGYQLMEKAPKTENSIRTLRVPEALLVELEKRRNLVNVRKEMMGDAYEDNDYVSCQKNGRSHYPSAFNIALTKLCSRNGLPHLTVHGLRHMYCTILTEQGVPLAKVSALLGHNSVHTTFEYYCEISDEQDHIIDFLNEGFVPEGGGKSA